MKEWSAAYAERGLTIVAVHGRGSGRPVADVVESWDITYPVADDRGGDTWAHYDVRVTPTYALIAPNGSLAHRQVGRVTTDATLERIEGLLGT